MGVQKDVIRRVMASKLPFAVKASMCYGLYMVHEFTRLRRERTALRIEKEKAKRARQSPDARDRASRMRDVDKITDAQFRQMFMLTRQLMEEVVQRVTPYLPKNEINADHEQSFVLRNHFV